MPVITMRHSRAIVVAVVLIAMGWSLWSLTDFSQGGRSAKPPPSIGELISRAKVARAGSWPRGRKHRDSFTFEHHGNTMTVDLAQVRRSHELLVRQPPSSSDVTAPRAPDPDFNFLSWPQRKFLEEETIKTRKCWVIDFTPPENTGPHCLVRLFVDQKLGALMRMQAYDWSEKRVLSYAVTAGKKVNGELTVKTAEALHYKPGTSKVVEEVEYRLP